MNKDPTINKTFTMNNGSYTRQDRKPMSMTTKRSIIISAYNRIALDVSSTTIQHVRLDENGKYSETIQSGLNNILTTEANIDQSSKAFLLDIVMSMFDEGVVAVVPIDTTSDPSISGAFDIQTMRTAKITQWYPQHVKVRVYNEIIGEYEEGVAVMVFYQIGEWFQDAAVNNAKRSIKLWKSHNNT
jgi:cation transport ATPase